MVPRWNFRMYKLNKIFQKLKQVSSARPPLPQRGRKVGWPPSCTGSLEESDPLFMRYWEFGSHFKEKCELRVKWQSHYEKRHRTLGDFQDIFIMLAPKLHEIWLVQKKKTQLLVLWPKEVMSSIYSSHWIWFKHERNENEEKEEEGTQEGQCASFSGGPLVLNFIALGLSCLYAWPHTQRPVMSMPIMPLGLMYILRLLYVIRCFRVMAC
jgi:hypothetical protein